ncbi:MAG: HAMP domain-containing histidine kinase [Chlorobi bacterium]|nr:HAMP domain-containing histidine kinase [Chlorobiota bacterium]
MQILNNIKFITGDPEQFNIKHRILNATLLAGAVLFFIVLIANIILQLNWIVNILIIIGIVLFITLYVYSRKTGKYFLPEVLAFGYLVFLFTPIVWFANGGSNSPFQYYIPFFIVGMHVSVSVKTRRILIPSLITISILLIIVEYFHPELVVNYENRLSRYVDLIIGMFFSLTGTYIFANVYFNLLEDANNKLKEKNIKLNKIREEVIAHEKLIKQQNIELEEKARKLEELNRSKDRFLSIISHDLRSPFNSLLGLTEILILNKEKVNNPEIIRLVDGIHESAEQAYKLVLNLLEWSKMHSNRMEYTPVKLNLKKVIKNNIDLAKLQAKNKGVKIQFEDTTGTCIVRADENMVNTIIRNMLSNAIKYTRGGGNVTIKCECNGENCRVDISDTGIGIPERVLKQILDTENKISTKGTSGEIGTGLGLVLCKEFARINKGKITAVSEINKGSTFTLILPSYKDVF